MHLLITTIGTRGDVQPYVALGKALQARGHRVTLATSPLFEGFVREHGLEFGPIHVDVQGGFDESLSDIGGNPLRLIQWMKRQYDRNFRQAAQDLMRLLPLADAAVFSTLMFVTYHAAEKFRIPAIAAYPQPVTPTRAFSSPGVAVPGWLPFQRVWNQFSFTMTNRLFMSVIKDPLNHARTETFGMPPLPDGFLKTIYRSSIPILYGYSPALLPKPADWDAHKHVTGFWRLEQEAGWEPPAALVDFIQGGSPPIYIGFGSMSDEDGHRFTDIAIEALARAGQRGILLSGWLTKHRVDNLPEHVFQIDGAPHDWLFPKMRAVVHHGGAGTTAASLHAGKPTVIVPFFADQPWWGEMVYRRGVGPQPIPRKHLTAARLAAAITTAVQDPRMQANAAQMGETLRVERGADTAASLIEHYLKAENRQLLIHRQ